VLTAALPLLLRGGSPRRGGLRRAGRVLHRAERDLGRVRRALGARRLVGRLLGSRRGGGGGARLGLARLGRRGLVRARRRGGGRVVTHRLHLRGLLLLRLHLLEPLDLG